MSLAPKQVQDQITKYLNKNASNDIGASYNLFKIVERLAWLQKYFTEHHNTYSNSLIKFLLTKIKPVLEGLEEPTIFKASSDNVVAQRDTVLHNLLSGNIGDFFKGTADIF